MDTLRAKYHERSRVTNVGPTDFCIFCRQGSYSTPGHKPECLHERVYQEQERIKSKAKPSNRGEQMFSVRQTLSTAKSGDTMKIEHYRLSKPYKPFVLVFDGQDLVLSIFSFYCRFKGLKAEELR